MKSDIIIAENISKSFGGVQALKDVSVSISKGEIRCLAGENGCGKSTFVKTVAGVLQPDSGKITINNKYYHRLSAIDAIKEGIQVIYQDLSLFGHMTVAENIAMNKMISERRRFIDWKEISSIAQEQLDLIGVNIDLNAKVKEISIANRQLVAICRALSQDTKILFMDEPTTALTNKEVERLLSIVLDLKAKGISVVFISHKLNEVFEVADTITIFRDGEKVGDFLSENLDQKKLIYYMTGRDVEYPFYNKKSKDDKLFLEVKKLTKEGNYKNISFNVKKGDIVGLTGLLGSGRTELALSLFGLNPPDSGTIKIDGEEVYIKSPKDAVEKGIGLLPEDRSTQGLFLNKSINENISSARLDKIKNKFGFLNTSTQIDVANEKVKKLRIRTPSIEIPVKALSGGNQQKTVIAKWIAINPKLFILDTPTVGVDVGAKSEIYEQIHGFAESGMGVILISDEFEEIRANCNKVIVMREGKIAGILNEEVIKSEHFDEAVTSLINGTNSSSKEDVQIEEECI